jgi:hypothetical protein
MGIIVQISKTIIVYMILVGRREVRGTLGRPRSRWKFNIKSDV